MAESSKPLSIPAVWYELVHCKIWFDGNGQKYIAHPVIGYYSTFRNAYKAGRMLGCRFLPHCDYWNFEKCASGEAYFVIPQYVVVTSACGRRGWLAADVDKRFQTEVELDE